MAGQVIEHWESRSESDDDAEFIFNVIGEPSPLIAQSLVLAIVPTTYHNKYRGPMGLVPTGPGMWKFKFRYIKIKVDMVIDFTPEKVKIMKSKETIANYNVRDIDDFSVIGPDFGGLIGVSKDKVEGLEIYAKGTFKIEMKWTLPRDSYPATYIDSVMRNTCIVNDKPLMLTYQSQILYFAKGEILYVGGNYKDGGEGSGSEIILRFEGRYNETDIKVGDMTGFFPDITTRLVDDGIDAAALLMVVNDPSGFPTPPFIVFVDTEQILVTAVASINWTVQRAQNGSTAEAHPNNSLVTYKGGPAPASSIYGTISKEGFQYIWMRTSEVTQDFGDGRVKVETPESVHIEKVYDYGDFEFLQVFDIINNYTEDLADILDEEEDDEVADSTDVWGFFGAPPGYLSSGS